MTTGRDLKPDDAFWEWVVDNYNLQQAAFIERDPDALSTVWEAYLPRAEQLQQRGQRGTEPTLRQESEFWKWMWQQNPAIAGQLQGVKAETGTLSGTPQFEYFAKNVYTDPFVELPAGRPDPEKFGLTEDDWRTLMMLGRDPERITTEIQRWITGGYITQFQARDIYDEADLRLRQAEAILSSTGLTQAEWDTLSDEDKTALVQQRAGFRPKRQPLTYTAPRQPKPPPFTEFGPGLERAREGFFQQVPSTERARDWFRSRYPLLIEQFTAKTPEEERGPETFEAFLKGRGPRIREQFARLSPFERGERPSTFQPRITTVGF